jgi:hypothetical protein
MLNKSNCHVDPLQSMRVSIGCRGTVSLILVLFITHNKIYAVVLRPCFTVLSWDILVTDYYSPQPTKRPRFGIFILHNYVYIFCLPTYPGIRILLRCGILTMLGVQKNLRISSISRTQNYPVTIFFTVSAIFNLLAPELF